MVARLTERWHYIRDGDGKEALYDYRADPTEAVDLVDSPELQQVVAALRRGLHGRE